MPVSYTYPGVYIDEVPNRVKTISGVSTSITAFIGRALRGQVDDPVHIRSFSEYERTFGSLWVDSTMSYAVQQYFLNGGNDAVIVRVVNLAKTAVLRLSSDTVSLVLEAANPGAWANKLRTVVNYATIDELDTNLFNLTIEELGPSDNVVRSEVFHNVSIDNTSPYFIDHVLERDSELVIVSTSTTERPDEGITVVNKIDIGSDGDAIGASQISSGSDLEIKEQGLWALKKTDLFNLLNIPPFDRYTDVTNITLKSALDYCKRRHAMLLIDAPMAWNNVSDALDPDTGIESVITRDADAAIFFPYLFISDPLQQNHLINLAPGGAVAGVFARTDTSRGVWRAPAGNGASLRGVSKLNLMLTDDENGQLNAVAINCLRSFADRDPVVWGSRTMAGADSLGSEWKYISVRRLALYIEESLFRGTQWVVFEGNDEFLWGRIRLAVGEFMNNLFREGAFQGSSASDAYFVKCDKETTTQNDVASGFVNIIIGFAPLKPAEFVIIKLKHLTRVDD